LLHETHHAAIILLQKLAAGGMVQFQYQSINQSEIFKVA